MRYTWDYYANRAKQIAKRIVTGDEVNKDGVRLIQIVYKQDMYATDALNMKYARASSKASVHTYAGGMQEITTEHSDGTQGLFKSDGQYQPTENNMDKEILNYMKKNLGESTHYKNRIRLTESQLHRVIKESVKKVLNESGQHTVNDLADILKDMASYVEHCQSGGDESVDGYFREIIGTGLYHDAIGKSTDFSNGVNTFITDY